MSRKQCIPWWDAALCSVSSGPGIWVHTVYLGLSVGIYMVNICSLRIDVQHRDMVRMSYWACFLIILRKKKGLTFCANLKRQFAWNASSIFFFFIFIYLFFFYFFLLLFFFFFLMGGEVEDNKNHNQFAICWTYWNDLSYLWFIVINP